MIELLSSDLDIFIIGLLSQGMSNNWLRIEWWWHYQRHSSYKHKVRSICTFLPLRKNPHEVLLSCCRASGRIENAVES